LPELVADRLVRFPSAITTGVVAIALLMVTISAPYIAIPITYDDRVVVANHDINTGIFLILEGAIPFNHLTYLL
jgi:hypothetical protein